jgi:hypothetical protein
MRLKVCFVAICATIAANPGFAATLPGVIDATYGQFPVVPPTLSTIMVCHGFGCKYRAELDLTAADRAKLTQLMAAGKASPEAERKAVAAAGAWFDLRVAPIAETKNHVARAGMKYMWDIHQFDCIDSSRNTTSLLLVLDQLNLLRHHDVDLPEARGYMVDFRPPHATAVLVEKPSGVKWAVDSWTVGYGQPLEIMPLARWKTLD